MNSPAVGFSRTAYVDPPNCSVALSDSFPAPVPGVRDSKYLPSLLDLLTTNSSSVICDTELAPHAPLNAFTASVVK